MNETSKCQSMRIANGDFESYLTGYGLDIGCGPDKLKPPKGFARAWDKQHGDAQALYDLDDNSFDFVYSSHALEHMVDVPETLKNWTRVLKPGGFLYVVVPDYFFYEKCSWPSRYNSDHKHSFSLDITRALVNRSNHWAAQDVFELLGALGLKRITARLELDGFDYNKGMEDQTMGLALSQLCFIAQKS